MTTIYEAAGGDEGLLRLAEAWHARVLADDVVAHAFSHGYRSDHSVRLAAYWAEALGGHEEMNQRAIACFGDALVDARLAANEPLREALLRYFAWATTTTMGRYRESAADVPEGMSIPKWSWEGPTA
jgi:hemoglobin